MSDRSGVEIDYCPQCRGVWLDRGELDKIIERSLTQPAPADYRPEPGYKSGHGGGHDSGHNSGYDKRGGRRKESWLGDLFG